VSGYYDQTLTIDIVSWPAGSLNDLNALSVGIYPDLPAYTSWQALVGVNLTAEYPGGVIQYLPGLATSWSVSPDGTTYTFNLRPNVTYSNGDPFNAYQVWTVEYGFWYLSANATGWYGGYNNIFNMAPVQFGPASISLLQQSGLVNPSAQALAMMTNSSWPIYVVNPNTIAFRTMHPFPWFLGTFQGEQSLVYDAQYVLQNGGFGTPVSLNTYFNLNAIPGTGPYMVSNVVNSQFVEFTQNPTYWGKDLPESTIVSNPMIDPGHVKNVLIKVVPDATARYIDLSSGAAQVIDPVGGSNFALILANPDKYGYVVMPPDNGALALSSFNTKRYPTNITDVRLAIVHAINMTDLIMKAYHSLDAATPVVGPNAPVWAPYYDPGNLPLYSYNLTLASQYLAEAGFPNGTGLPPIVWLLDDTCQVCVTRATVVQADVAQIGIKITIQGVSFSDWCSVACEPYSWMVANVNQVGNIMDPADSNTEQPFLGPSILWAPYTTDTSPAANTAIYSTPLQIACTNSFFNGSSNATILSICTQAQSQFYNDAPYFDYAVLKYVFGDSSPAWNLAVVKNGYLDPLWAGCNDTPLFNTITFNTATSQD
jgi:ABC-type transport system substrate-binding protein